MTNAANDNVFFTLTHPHEVTFIRKWSLLWWYLLRQLEGAHRLNIKIFPA